MSILALHQSYEVILHRTIVISLPFIFQIIKSFDFNQRIHKDFLMDTLCNFNFSSCLGNIRLDSIECIVVFHRSIESYTATGFSIGPLFKAVGEFIGVFGGSFILGGFMGLLTALVSFSEDFSYGSPAVDGA